jgi:hypothetical protein
MRVVAALRPGIRNIVAGLALAAALPAAAEAPPQGLVPIDLVWSAHPVRFGLAATDDVIVVAYYDAGRQLSLASRPRRDPAGWRYHKLPSWTGWDSHNALSVAIDREGQIHVIGNLHNDPLLYFRSEAPGDIRGMKRIATLVDAQLEQRMTYPVFLKTADGRLVLKYRDGGSGDGNEIYNVYDERTQRWSALLARPLVDGEGKRNAYFAGPVRGPDGRFHLAWVWRETPDAETTHDLSYAVSDELVSWKRSDGTALTLPMRLATAEIVDAVPAGGGIINNNIVPGFDSAGRTLIAYHKYDARGGTQVYVARRDAAGWTVARASDWRGFRWDFRGRGSLDFRLSIDSVESTGDGHLRVRIKRDGHARDLILDEATLNRVADNPGTKTPLEALVPAPPGMEVSIQVEGPLALAWATLPPNRDLPSPTVPAPTVLYLVERGENAGTAR